MAVSHRSCRNKAETSELTMIVKLRKQYEKYPDLTPDQPYVVIGIEADDFRLLNDHGRPYLYPHNLFEVVDPR